GLARARGTDAEDKLVRHQRIYIGALRLRTRGDDATLRLNLVARETALGLFEIGIGGSRHPDCAIDLTGIHFLTGLQAGIKIAEDAIGLAAGMGVTGDDKFVAARGRQHTKALLDSREIPVVRSEKLRKETIIVEGDDKTVVASGLTLRAFHPTR